MYALTLEQQLRFLSKVRCKRGHDLTDEKNIYTTTQALPRRRQQAA